MKHYYYILILSFLFIQLKTLQAAQYPMGQEKKSAQQGPPLVGGVTIKKGKKSSRRRSPQKQTLADQDQLDLKKEAQEEKVLETAAVISLLSQQPLSPKNKIQEAKPAVIMPKEDGAPEEAKLFRFMVKEEAVKAEDLEDFELVLSPEELSKARQKELSEQYEQFEVIKEEKTAAEDETTTAGKNTKESSSWTSFLTFGYF